MTCHISSELTPRRRKTQSVEVGGPNAKDVALGKASQPGDAGGIVISLKAVWGQFPSRRQSTEDVAAISRLGSSPSKVTAGGITSAGRVRGVVRLPPNEVERARPGSIGN
jgi:hypothetical protein